jgi:predicted acyl esterase
VSTEKLRYVLARLRGLARPPITVRPAPADEVVFERDVAVSMRDGTVLRVNVFRPPGEGPHPALLCAHPYGKDNLPAPRQGVDEPRAGPRQGPGADAGLRQLLRQQPAQPRLDPRLRGRRLGAALALHPPRRKWSTYYSAGAPAAQERFFDHFLKGLDNGMDSEPAVRLEVREDRDTIHAVRGEEAWPPPGVRWTELFLGADGRLGEEPSAARGEVAFATAKGRATWAWRVPRDLEPVGPMALRLRVSLEGAEDANLFAGVEKWRDGRFVPFEGSYGFGLDRVTPAGRSSPTGSPTRSAPAPSRRSTATTRRDRWGRARSPRSGSRSAPRQPSSGRVRRCGSSSGGRWMHPRNPITGQYPAAYEPSPDCTVRVHCGDDPAPRLLVPVID